ncbi:lipocalin family protein [Cellulomonas sp. HZM]|uniref:lipocalin family protein n=1 Tax=Cellulomonas sp. HZM TaxID=1454010 RepID=UPI0004933EC0|nr:lipocalin family protein [Cellulomonas sp. HZM]
MRITLRTTRAVTAAALAVCALVVPATASTAATPATAPSASTQGGGVVGVSGLDVPRYLGTWYQVAAVPALYELQCARDVTATYTLTSATTLGVRNVCRTWFGGTSSVTGEGKVLNAPDSSELNVAFLKVGGRYVHLGGADYVVVGVGSAYDWAVVGDPTRLSGFVLSRTPSLGADQLAQVRAAIAGAGYDACDFSLTPQTSGQKSRGPLC